MRQLPLHEPLVGKDGKLSMTSSWLDILRNPGLSAPEAQTIVKEYVTTTVRGLVAGAPDGIPIAQNSIVDANILDGSILGTSLAPNTITEKNVVNGTFTGLSMALKTILVSGDTWTDNSPGAGSIAWSSFTISYDGVTTTINAGNTSNTYIYWDGASATLTTSNANPILGDNAFMIATNISGTHSIAYNKIAQQQIGAAWIQLASITDAQIASLNAGKITAGVIRSISSFSSTFATKGSNLTQATVGADTTVYVENTADFPASGSAQIIDATNDRNTFAYTGKTGTTLTGCSGVLAHNNYAVVVPLIKNMVIDNNINEMRFFGDNGSGTIEELATIGITAESGNNVIGAFGTQTVGNARLAILAQSDSGIGIFSISVLNTAILGNSITGKGVYGQGLPGGYFVASNSSLSSAIQLVQSGTGSAVISPGATWIPSIPGFYNIGCPTADEVVIQILVGGGWYNAGGAASGMNWLGCMYFDGTNQRVNDLGGSGVTIYWQKY